MVPVIYFLTFSTYGTHLPGDARGSTDRHQGRLASVPGLARFAESEMQETPYRMELATDRRAVRDAILEVCRHREWRLLALHVRADHVHGVVQAERVTPGRVMGDWKSYSSRGLRVRRPDRQKFWTEGGDVRSVRGPELARILAYVLEGQGEPMEIYDAGQPDL